MRASFHRLFPNWVSPPPTPRVPTDLERLEALIASQRTRLLEQRVLAAQSIADSHREEVLLHALIEELEKRQ